MLLEGVVQCDQAGEIVGVCDESCPDYNDLYGQYLVQSFELLGIIKK